MKRKRIAAAVLTALLLLSGGLPGHFPGTFCVVSEAASLLAAPGNVRAAVSGSTIKLTWDKVKNAAAYRIFTYNADTGKYMTYTTTKRTSVTIKDATEGEYRFRVAALAVKNGKYSVQTRSSAVRAKVLSEEVNMTDRITVNTQSSIRIDAGNAVIRIDPFGITGEPHDADIIFITHDHYDHYSPEDIKKVVKPDTVFAAPESMKKQLEKDGIKNVVLLKAGDKTEIAGFAVETVKAYNKGKPFHPESKGWLGYILTVNGSIIYAAGDTDATKDTEAVKCDIALVPIGGTYTMNVKDAAALINTIRPKTVIPVHYGSIVGSRSDGEKFRKLVDSGIEVVLKL